MIDPRKELFTPKEQQYRLVGDLNPRTVYSFNISAKFMDGIWGTPFSLRVETQTDGQWSVFYNQLFDFSPLFLLLVADPVLSVFCTIVSIFALNLVIMVVLCCQCSCTKSCEYSCTLLCYQFWMAGLVFCELFVILFSFWCRCGQRCKVSFCVVMTFGRKPFAGVIFPLVNSFNHSCLIDKTPNVFCCISIMWPVMWPYSICLIPCESDRVHFYLFLCFYLASVCLSVLSCVFLVLHTNSLIHYFLYSRQTKGNAEFLIFLWISADWLAMMMLFPYVWHSEKSDQSPSLYWYQLPTSI